MVPNPLQSTARSSKYQQAQKKHLSIQVVALTPGWVLGSFKNRAAWPHSHTPWLTGPEYALNKNSPCDCSASSSFPSTLLDGLLDLSRGSAYGVSRLRPPVSSET